MLAFGCGNQGNSNPSTVTSSATNQPGTQPSVQVKPEQTNDKLQVVSIGYGGNTAQTTVGLLVENPSKTLAALGITIRVTGRDTAGNVIGTSDATVPLIRAGQKMGVSTTSFGNADAKPAHFDTLMQVETWTKDPHPTAVIEGKGAHLDRNVPSEYAGYKDYGAILLGEVISHYKTDYTASPANPMGQQVRVIGLCFKGDTVVQHGNATVGLIPPETPVGVSISTMGSDKPDRCEIYGTPDGPRASYGFFLLDQPTPSP
jgi:hypothetical protein